MHVEVRKVNQHARLQDDRLLGSHKPSVSFDNPQCGRHTWVEAIDLHDDCIEVWHLGSDGGEVYVLDGLDLGKKLGEDIGALLQLDQRPCDIGADTVMAASHVSMQYS